MWRLFNSSQTGDSLALKSRLIFLNKVLAGLAGRYSSSSNLSSSLGGLPFLRLRFYAMGSARLPFLGFYAMGSARLPFLGFYAMGCAL